MVLTPEERREAWRKAAAVRRRERLESCNAVPLAPFQERFLLLERRGELTMYQLCLRMEWTRRPAPSRGNHKRHPDTSTGQRVLGFRHDTRRGDTCPRAPRKVIAFDTAVKLADALGMAPHEAGV